MSRQIKILSGLEGLNTNQLEISGVTVLKASDNYISSIAIGQNTDVIESNSIAIGAGNQSNASGSTVIGGINNTISSNDAVLLGGYNLNITGTSYSNHTLVSNLAILNQPFGGTSGDTVLVRDSSTGIIKSIPQSGVTGGGGGTSLTFNNGLTDNSGTVSLGGFLNKETSIDTANNSLVLSNNISFSYNNLDLIDSFDFTNSANILTSTKTINGNIFFGGTAGIYVVTNNTLSDGDVFTTSSIPSGFTGGFTGGTGSLFDIAGDYVANNKVYVGRQDGTLYTIDYDTNEVTRVLSGSTNIGGIDTPSSIRYVDYVESIFVSFFESYLVLASPSEVVVVTPDLATSYAKYTTTTGSTGELLPAAGSISDVKVIVDGNSNSLIVVLKNGQLFITRPNNNFEATILDSNGLSNNLLFSELNGQIEGLVTRIYKDRIGLDKPLYFSSDAGYLYALGGSLNTTLTITTILTPNDIGIGNQIDYVSIDGDIVTILVDDGNVYSYDSENDATIFLGVQPTITGTFLAGETVNSITYFGGSTSDIYKLSSDNFIITSNINGLQYPSNYTPLSGTSLVTLGYLTGNTASPIQSNDTEIIFNNNGSLSGNTAFTFSGATQSLTHGSREIGVCIGYRSVVLAGGTYSAACGDYSTSIGKNVYSIGCSSFSQGIYSRSCGIASVALNTSVSFGICSFAAGSSRSYGTYSTALGNFTKALSDYSFTVGNNNSASGVTSFVSGNNNKTYSFGSAILGGNNHNIESGNTRAAIIGGNTINLTGTTYIDHTAVSKLAIMDSPANGSSGDTVLVRDASTGIIKEVAQTSVGSSLTFNNGLTDNGGTVSLGGTLTGNTIIDTNGFGIAIGSTSAYVNGLNSISFNIGSTSADYSAAFNDSIVSGNYSTAFNKSRTYGINSVSFGYNTHTCGNNSLTAGRGGYAGAPYFSPIELVNNGNSSFLFTGLGSGLSIPSDYGIDSNYSAIIGGQNHKIESGNTRAAIIGGNTIKLTGTTYIDTTAMSNLAIMSTPSAGASGDTVLVRDSSTGIIRQIPQSGLTKPSDAFTITGDSTTTGFTLTHNLGTRDLIVQVYENQSPYGNPIVEILRTDTNNIDINFDTAPANGEDYRVILLEI